MNNGQEDRAKAIAQNIQDRTQPLSVDAMNRIYDIVLNMNSLNSKPSGDGNYVHVILIDIMAQLKEAKEEAMRRPPPPKADFRP